MVRDCVSLTQVPEYKLSGVKMEKQKKQKDVLENKMSNTPIPENHLRPYQHGLMRKIKSNKVYFTILEYALITVSVVIMAMGVYFFKFPNNFSFGGVTGYAKIVEHFTGISATLFTHITNIFLLVLGFIFVGKKFAVKTVYATLVFSVSLIYFERNFLLTTPITDQPLLELIFAVLIPSIATALLFNIGASGGGTDILAMILKKYTSFDIGSMLFIVDFISVALSFAVFGVTTGLFSALGLFAKSLVIDDVIESINMCKCFTIVSDDPEPICDFIIHILGRSATIYEAMGAYRHEKKKIVLATLDRLQAVKLRNFIRDHDPMAFMIITKSSEIIGKGFHTG